MELMEIAFSILLAIVSCAVSWLASRYYYIKAKPERTSVYALVSAAHAKSRKTGPADGTSKDPDVPLQLVLELVKAFEEGQIYLPELIVCARTYQIVGDLLMEALQASAEVGEAAGPTLSPSWVDAREKALKQGLVRAKQEIVRRLNQPRSADDHVG